MAPVKTNKPVVLIMAGGKGERFWPRSRSRNPKQLQKVYSNKTLLDETIDRARTITSLDRIFVGCNDELKKATLKTHRRLKANQFIVEPEGRNTAPIVALAALHFEKRFPGSVHVVLSADHYISTLAQFKTTLQKAVKAAENEMLVTLGVRPNRPETGYGYIQIGEKLNNIPAHKIKSFKEKPSTKIAKKYLTQGNQYYWNSGIFIWKGSRILTEFERHAPEILTPLKDSFTSQKKLKQIFSKIPSEPVDTAIMEKSNNLAVVEASFVWDDVGAWTALDRICEHDRDQNVFFTDSKKAKLATRDSKGNIIVSSKPLVSLLGMQDLILVEEEDILFLANKQSIADIKEFMKDMKSKAALQKFFR